jgi:hypothetical protein
VKPNKLLLCSYDFQLVHDFQFKFKTSHLNWKTSHFLPFELQIILKKSKFCLPSPYKYPPPVWTHFTHISSHLHSFLYSTQSRTIGVMTCKFGMTFSTPLNSRLCNISMSLSMPLCSIVSPMLHQHHTLVLCFNYLHIHLRCHILHHI